MLPPRTEAYINRVRAMVAHAVKPRSKYESTYRCRRSPGIKVRQVTYCYRRRGKCSCSIFITSWALLYRVGGIYTVANTIPYTARK